MNRQQRRAAAARERKTHEVFYTKTFAVVLANGERHLFWFKEPDGFTTADGENLLAWVCSEEHAIDPGIELFGPFKTDAEVRESQRLTLLGPQCEVSDGGVLHSAPEGLQ